MPRRRQWALSVLPAGGFGNVPRDVGIQVSKRLLAPRVGFAYRIGADWVVRSGYGITYDPMPFSRLAFAGSLVWISLSYSGFNAAVYVAGEAKDAQRNAPKALVRPA